MTTVFWIGEQPAGNNPVPNFKSSWDANWAASYGGFDTPDSSNRRNYIPVSFVPRAESILLRAALQRRHARPVQTGSGAGDSLVQTGLHRAGPIGLQSIAGSRFAREIAPATRNGKIADRFAPIIFSMFSGTSGRSRT